MAFTVKELDILHPFISYNVIKHLLLSYEDDNFDECVFYYKIVISIEMRHIMLSKVVLIKDALYDF